MTLADTLSFIREDNYLLMSFIIGFVIGIIPGIGVLGPLAGGFLYAYFSMYFGDVPRDQGEAIKRGAVMGLILSLIGLVIAALTWGALVPAMHFMVFAPILIINAIIVGLIIGAVLGAVGGLVAFYVE